MDYYERRKRAFHLTIDLLKKKKSRESIYFAAMHNYGIGKKIIDQFIQSIEETAAREKK